MGNEGVDMCLLNDRGCLVDIKNIKEDSAEIKADLKEFIRNQDQINKKISIHETRISIVEENVKSTKEQSADIKTKAWQIISAILIFIILYILGKNI